MFGITIALISALSGKARPISYRSFEYNRHFYHMVVANVPGGSCQVKTVQNNWLVSAHKLLAKSRPFVAITGTFFSPGSQKAVADILVDGNLVCRGARGTVVAVNKFGDVKIFDAPYNRPIDWSNYQFGLRGGVRVVDGGVVRPNPVAQRFHDKNIWGNASRVGLGLTKGGVLLLFATKNKVSLSELGRAMKLHGVRNGVSLDGGASTCFYYNGSFIIEPQRKLCNMLVVSEKL
jgi:exopolysaccharide biosynthesis protein